MMGSGTNTFIIFLTISLALTLSNPTEWGSPMSALLTINLDDGVMDTNAFINQTLGVLTLAIGVGIAAGYVTKNPGFAFAGALGTFLMGFALTPINFFMDASIPTFIRVMIGIPLSALYVMSLISWFRGVDM